MAHCAWALLPEALSLPWVCVCQWVLQSCLHSFFFFYWLPLSPLTLCLFLHSGFGDIDFCLQYVQDGGIQKPCNNIKPVSVEFDSCDIFIFFKGSRGHPITSSWPGHGVRIVLIMLGHGVRPGMLRAVTKLKWPKSWKGWPVSRWCHSRQRQHVNHVCL